MFLLPIRVIKITFVATLLSSLTHEYDAKRKKSEGEMLSGVEKISALHEYEKDGIIKITSTMYKKYIMRPNRPYHSFVLFTALSERFNCAACRYFPSLYD